MTKTFIIAEVGVNHNADLKLAYELVDIAVSSGANAVKFQTAIPELVATSNAPKAGYQEVNTNSIESQLEMIKKIHLPLDAYDAIKSYCDKKDIIFFSTAFDLVSLEYIEKLGQPFHKVPSGEITNLPYLRKMGGYGKPIFLSTGMASLGEIEAALEVLITSGIKRELITILHCNTQYPTPMKDVNLLAMNSIRDAFGVAVGYSDHTAGIEVSIAAVTLGATVIEKHFTIDRNLPGPDHKASLEPKELANMIKAIRNIEVALGSQVKFPSESEIDNKPVARKSLIAACKIKTGELFTEKNMTVKRPGTGLSPMLWDDVVGKKATCDFDVDELISL
jgi:N,N'-diacetyllegionaminate synthase